jgi:hypothetical protein
MSTDELQVHRLRARKKPRQPGSMELRHWLAILLSFCLLGAIVTASSSIGFFGTMFSHVTSARTVSQASPEHAPRATTVVGSETKWCKRLEFDNENGRVFEANDPCDGEGLHDANGNPIPAGTMSRLDAIRKSFLGQ